MIPRMRAPTHVRCAPPPACPQLSDEGPAEDDEGEEGVPSYRELLLPALDLAGQWEVRCGAGG